MKTTKEKADELVNKFYYYEFDRVESHEAAIYQSIKQSIISVKHTIDYLKSISSNFIIDPNMKYAFDVIAFSIYEQEQLLTELESRL